MSSSSCSVLPLLLLTILTQKTHGAIFRNLDDVTEPTTTTPSSSGKLQDEISLITGAINNGSLDILTGIDINPQGDIILSIINGIESAAAQLVNLFVDVSKKDVRILYYNQSDINETLADFTLDNITDLYRVFDPTKESFYIVHGWISSYTSEVNIEIKEAVLKNHDVNLFIVNWYSYTGYVYAYNAFPIYGRYFGEFLNEISSRFNYSNWNVRMACHSLGAHLCGVAGRVAGGSVRNIVGLDPAGPLFNFNTNLSIQLNVGDAHFVQVIHSNSELFGIKRSIGDANFWVNGGNTQPQCANIIDNVSGCSHFGCFKYYSQSIVNGGFEAIKCTNNETGSDDYYCDSSQITYMGGYHLNESATGEFYLETGADPPYALGTSWI